jgi:dolichol-phosphate mannosyltransferase
MNYAINGIVAFSTKPLRYITYLGTTTVSISLLYLLIYVIKCLSKTSTSEISMLIFLILFFSGIIITCIGIVGEYVGKIYNETKNRPIFITKVKIGFDEEIL